MSADKGGYISVEDTCARLAQLRGTSIDNIEYRNGIFYVWVRGMGGVVTHKYEVAEG